MSITLPGGSTRDGAEPAETTLAPGQRPGARRLKRTGKLRRNSVVRYSVFDSHDFDQSVLHEVIERGEIFFTNFHQSPSLSVASWQSGVAAV
jgi:hypothetical protein